MAAECGGGCLGLQSVRHDMTPCNIFSVSVGEVNFIIMNGSATFNTPMYRSWRWCRGYFISCLSFPNLWSFFSLFKNITPTFLSSKLAPTATVNVSGGCMHWPHTLPCRCHAMLCNVCTTQPRWAASCKIYGSISGGYVGYSELQVATVGNHSSHTTIA